MSYMKQILKLYTYDTNWYWIYRKDFQELVKNSIEKCISDGAPFDFETVLVSANKRERWVRVIGDTMYSWR
jgi:hypothetical protein